SLHDARYRHLSPAAAVLDRCSSGVRAAARAARGGSGPGFDGGVAVAGDRDVTVVETRIARGEVASQVGATALGAGERRSGDQANLRTRIVEQGSQTVAVALEAGLVPQSLAAALGQLGGRT